MLNENREEATTMMLERLTEAWGDIVTDSEATQGEVYRHNATITNIRDRSDGRHLPVYETEWDVRTIAMLGRLLHEQVPMGKAKTHRLRDYTIATGFDWNITHDSPAVQDACNKLITRFMRDNQWQEEWERESFVQECVDGNFLAELTVEDKQIVMTPMYLDNLAEPLNPRQLEEYYDIDYPASWSFGVLSPEQRAHDPRGYHIVRNENGTDWAYIPEANFIHWKRNTPPTAKLGVSDHYTAHLYLGRADKVLARTAEGAAIQAAIAYVVEHGPDVTGSQVGRILSNLKNSDGTNERTGLTERRIGSRAGTSRIDTYNGAKYHAGPLGDTGRSAIYIEVMESILRLSGTPDAIPEYMMTGSAENNNFASIKESASPFVQGRNADQAKRGQRLERLIEKVLKLAANSGLLAIAGISSWDDLENSLDITTSAPDIYSRESVTADLIAQIEAKLVSKRTATNKLGYEYDNEQAQIQDEGGAAPGALEGAQTSPPPGSGSMAGLSRQQWKRNRAAIDDVVTDYENGQLTRAKAATMLKTLGLDEPTAESLLGDEPAAPLTQAAEQVLREAWDDYYGQYSEAFNSRQPRGKDGKWIDKSTIQAVAASKDQKARLDLLAGAADKDKARLAKQLDVAMGGDGNIRGGLMANDLKIARRMSKASGDTKPAKKPTIAATDKFTDQHAEAASRLKKFEKWAEESGWDDDDDGLWAPSADQAFSTSDKSGSAAITMFASHHFTEMNANPDSPAAKAMRDTISTLPDYSPKSGKIHRVLGFASQAEVDKYVSTVGKQDKAFASWTAEDPMAPGATAMNNIGLDVASQFGEHTVILNYKDPAGAKDITFAYGSNRTGTEQITQKGQQFKVENIRRDGNKTIIDLNGEG